MIIREMDKGIYFSRKKVQLFGIHIPNFTLDEAVAILTECLLPGDGQSRYVVTPNATQIVQLRKDQFLRRIYHEADLVVADGMPVIWVSRLLGRPLRERVTGSDLLPRLCAEAVFQALAQLAREEYPEEVWLYRGAWQEWDIDMVDMAVPLSREQITRKIFGIFKHQSQKDKAMFPGPYDDREFWQRAEARNRQTAALYDQLGLPEYYGIEAFVRYDRPEGF